MGDECKHLWQVVPPDGMAEGYWRCRFCGVTQDDPLELDSARDDAPDEMAALRADREILNELTALADAWREYAERPDCADSLTYRAASDWIMHVLAGNSHAALPYFLGDALTEGRDV